MTILQMLQVAADNVSRAWYILELFPSANLAQNLPVESSSSCKASCCHHKNGPIAWFLVIITEPFNSLHLILCLHDLVKSCRKIFCLKLYFWKQFSLISRKGFQNFGVTIQQHSCMIYRIVYVSVLAPVSGSLNKKNTEPKYNLASGNLNNCRLVGPCQVL